MVSARLREEYSLSFVHFVDFPTVLEHFNFFGKPADRIIPKVCVHVKQVTVRCCCRGHALEIEQKCRVPINLARIHI